MYITHIISFLSRGANLEDRFAHPLRDLCALVGSQGEVPAHEVERLERLEREPLRPEKRRNVMDAVRRKVLSQ
jgi:hypothetical protein